LEQRSDDLWIFIGPRRRWGVVAFTSFWLCGWVVGEIMAITNLFNYLSGGKTGPDPSGFPVPLFLLVWLTVWTIGGIVIFFVIVNELWRWEEINVSRSLLYKRIRIGPWRRETFIHVETIEEIRLTSPETHPKDWERTARASEMSHQGIVVQYDRGKRLLLVREAAERAGIRQEMSVVDRTRQALEDFRIPVSPLGEKRETSPAEEFKKSFKEFHDDFISLDQEETRAPGPVRPVGPEPFSQAIRRWNSQITLAILVVIGWAFWRHTGGVPSPFFALSLGYFLIFSITLVLVTQRGIRRRRAGKPYSPPLKGTWKDEFAAILPVLLVCACLGGLIWFFLLNVPSRSLGRWDLVRRHVYSIGPAHELTRDAAGNRYAYRDLFSACPRVHKYGPDGRFQWAISVPRSGKDAPRITVNYADGTIEVATITDIETYDSNGWFLSSRPIKPTATTPEAPASHQD